MECSFGSKDIANCGWHHGTDAHPKFFKDDCVAQEWGVYSQRLACQQYQEPWICIANLFRHASANGFLTVVAPWAALERLWECLEKVCLCVCEDMCNASNPWPMISQVSPSQPIWFVQELVSGTWQKTFAFHSQTSCILQCCTWRRLCKALQNWNEACQGTA